MIQPAIVFAEPNRLPDPDGLGSAVVVLDVSFALPVPPAEFPLRDPRTQEWWSRQVEATARFVDALGPRLRLWVDHHQHALWPRFAGDRRFRLTPADRAPACALLVDEALCAEPTLASVDTVICHGDVDGLLSAARFLRRGAWPYPSAEQDAVAADTRRASLGPVGQLLDHALKARRDDAIRHAALNWLSFGDEGARQELERAAGEYEALVAEARRCAAEFRDVGICRIVDLRDRAEPVALTELLLELQGDDRVGVVIYQTDEREYLAVGSRKPGVDLPVLLGLPGGSPGRIHLAASHLGELVDALSPAGEPSRPRHALVEIVRRCNLRCPLCPVGNDLAERLPDMSFETFRLIVDQFASSLQSLTLHNYGEPLLHSEIGRFIRYAKDAGLKEVALTTNGNYLPVTLAEELVDSRLDFIRFSVDTTDPEAYRQYRRGGQLERVLANIGLLSSTRSSRGAVAPRIEAQALLMRTNEQHAADFEDVLLRAGADQVRWKTFNALMSGEVMLEQGAALVPLKASYRRHRELLPRPAVDRSEMRLCRWPWDRFVVLADGTVTPCCHDFNADYPLGSTEGAEASTVWDTPARRAFMLRRILEPESVAMCRRCPSGVPHLGVRRGANPRDSDDDE